MDRYTPEKHAYLIRLLEPGETSFIQNYFKEIL